MDLGDFFVQFMDLAEDEMKKNMDGILLQHSIASSRPVCSTNTLLMILS